MEGDKDDIMKLPPYIKKIVIGVVTGVLILVIGAPLSQMVIEKFKKQKAEMPTENASPSTSQNTENYYNSQKFIVGNMTINQSAPPSKEDSVPDKKEDRHNQTPKSAVGNRNWTEKKTMDNASSDLDAKQDKSNRLIWQKSIQNQVFTWPKAQEYCKNLVLDGYDDWRLPTINELEGLVDTSYSPPVDPVFGGFPDNYPPHVWSSTTERDDDSEAQFMNFRIGLPAHIKKEEGHGFVRCVRYG
ncbi:MAG: DUF1566 domain-containing protein [Nitrospirae bacterium]|nr:DUF1566 domain-containing protein [Nitrospirota bacterium]